MKILHARHATSLLEFGGQKILIDPVFADKDAYPAIPHTPNKRRNPMVSLITPMDKLLDVDLLLSTHAHLDHFDNKAKDMLDKSIKLVCQSEDENVFISAGFKNIRSITDTLSVGKIRITRVNAQHGVGITRKLMGVSSGYILESEDEPTLYITGDTLYNDDIKSNILKFNPKVLLMNAGSPKFINSAPIVMTKKDIENTMRVKPELDFVIVHLDTYNHCVETRSEIQNYFDYDRLSQIRVKGLHIPNDNEELIFE